MADTIVNTPSSGESGAAGWAVAAIVIVAVLIAGFFLLQRTKGANQDGGANINVTLPGGSGGTGGTGTGGTGGTGGGTTY